MKSNQFLKEGFVEDANEVHADHEVQMARADLFHAAEDALALHKLLRNVSEQQGLEGWVAAKITLAADYLKTVREHVEYQLMSGAESHPVIGNVLSVAETKNVKEGMLDNPGEEGSPVVQSIIRRILMQRTDLLAKYGPEKVGAAVDEVADFVGDVDEIGSSDVSGWIRHVERLLGNMGEGVAEGATSHSELARLAHEAYIAAVRSGNALMANHYKQAYEKHKRLAASERKSAAKGMAEEQVNETSAGSVAGVVNPTPKNKAKVGSLFGGTYKQTKTKAK